MYKVSLPFGMCYLLNVNAKIITLVREKEFDMTKINCDLYTPQDPGKFHRLSDRVQTRALQVFRGRPHTRECFSAEALGAAWPVPGLPWNRSEHVHSMVIIKLTRTNF